MNRLVYFAYGSNLHPLRLRLRAPRARVLGLATLRGVRALFHKLGLDGSGKCDACPTSGADDRVQGVLYQIRRRDLRALDRAEDLGRGYDRVGIRVSARGRGRAAFTYRARQDAIDDRLRPFDWYLGWVVRGACHHGLPRAYVRALAATPVLRDPRPARRLHNLGLTGRGSPPARRR